MVPHESIGNLDVMALSEVALRAACNKCHAPLTMFTRKDPDLLYVTIGTIDEGSIPNQKDRARLRPEAHIFVSQNVSWFDVGQDGIPCFGRFMSER